MLTYSIKFSIISATIKIHLEHLIQFIGWEQKKKASDAFEKNTKHKDRLLHFDDIGLPERHLMIQCNHMCELKYFQIVFCLFHIFTFDFWGE